MMLMNSMHPSIPFEDGSYRREFDAEVDCASQDELVVRGAFRDYRFDMFQVWRVKTPEYEVLEATAGDRSGFVDVHALANFGLIAGVRVGRGFTRWVLEKIGDRKGSHETLLFAIEMARVSQQVYQFPPDLENSFRSHSTDLTDLARAAWLKDRAYMPDLANSCYTYRDSSRELFDTREVRCGFDGSITRPKPGDKSVFWRKKQLSIQELDTSNWRCHIAMQDSIHDISVEFELSSAGIVSNAESRGLRLPYHGICEDAQLRTAMLNGMVITPRFSKQLGETVGGQSGCTHLFDLTSDCLRLFV